MTSDRLLTELERQRKYLKRLPAGFPFPLFNARQALESQRSSGYRDTAAAAREIIDNSIEAGAGRVDVLFETDRTSGKKLVTAIAFIDDGPGMDPPNMARFALTWGGGTHFDEHLSLGRFGFGLPNASINQTRRVEVYTRTVATEPVVRAVLDLDEFEKHFELQSIPPAEPSELPAFVAAFLKREGRKFDHGTVVVWVAPDRLTYRMSAYLKDHLVDDFAVVYRYLLKSDKVATEGRITLNVEGVGVEPIDPLFLTPGARYYLSPENGGATMVDERALTVALGRDPETKERRLRRVRDEEDLDRVVATGETVGVIRLRVARFPVGFAEDKGRRRGDTDDANRRFEVRKSRRGMSFVRAGREIQTVDAFPRSPHDVASGLGRWPLLQGYAYHWGVEVSFQPVLDDVFGITNDKQAVRPIEDFWRVLTEAEVDELLRVQNQWHAKHRNQPAKDSTSKSNIATPAEQSAQAADVAAGETARVPEHQLEEANENLRLEAEAKAAAEKASIEEARRALEQESKRRPYHVVYVEEKNGPFYEPRWVGAQVVVEINRAHPFFQVLYADLMRLTGARRAKEAVDLVLLALSKAELVADEEMSLWYEAQRTKRWSPFLATALRNLAQRFTDDEQEGEQELSGPTEPMKAAS